jgi:hypothetical protein
VKPKNPSLFSTPLWPHQRKAIDCIRKYLTAAQTNPDLGSALVHMPTGTGKTGVIACASHFLSAVGSVLILSPRIALRDQLAGEVAGRFFTKLGLTNRLPKTVHNIKDRFPSAAKLDLSQTIFVTTIQMLHSMVRHNSPNYKLLQDNVDLVIVDEGHYEPAISWREAIRGIAGPKVLFTATPFRNDLKLFDVQFDHAFSYTFDDAVKDKTIRAVKVHTRSNELTPSGFVSDVVRFYDSTFPNAHSQGDPPRVIIRCDSHATIRQIGTDLAAAGKSFVLIHENFKDNDSTRPHERRTVPDPQTESAVFWVHQFKLLEGIDDPRFHVIALFEELGTTRGLVQQIGRVVRNPSRKNNQVGHFLDHSSGRQAELWNEFLVFDSVLKRDGVKVADFGAKVLKAIQAAQPDIVYVDGRFRSRLILDNIDPVDELILPQTVNVVRKPTAFSLSDLREEILSDFAQRDRDVRECVVDANTVVFLYLAFRNSPLLRSKCFIECRLGATILRDAGNYLCVFDSSGGVPAPVADCCDSVDIKELRKLFPRNKNTFLTGVSLHNAQLGPRSIRSRSITASRLEDTLPTFDDHSFVCNTARGKCSLNGTAARRYVGFGQGKISDSSLGYVEFPDYVLWLDQITTVLASKATSITSFARFAKHADRPADTTPIHLLLDVGELVRGFAGSGLRGVSLCFLFSVVQVSTGRKRTRDQSHAPGPAGDARSVVIFGL